MGLLLVEQGRISTTQLREALFQQQRSEQRSGERVLLGKWLIESGILQETELTRALGAQWNCPVFSLAGCSPEEAGSAMPRFFVDTLNALPVRLAGGRLLYVAYAGHIDRSLNYALEHMNGVQVSAGIARDSEFRDARARSLLSEPPPVRFLEAANAGMLARALTRLIESEKPLEARLARVHDCWWLRMWRPAPRRAGLPARGEVHDCLCTIAGEFRSAG